MIVQPHLPEEDELHWRSLKIEAYILAMLGEMIDLAVAYQLSGTIAAVSVCHTLVAEMHRERVAQLTV